MQAEAVRPPMAPFSLSDIVAETNGNLEEAVFLQVGAGGGHLDSMDCN